MPVKNCRTVGKKDMKFNDTMPKMKVDPESYVSLPFLTIMAIHIVPLVYRTNLYPQQTVEADGMLCDAEPASELPLTQAYYIF
jgi:urease